MTGAIDYFSLGHPLSRVRSFYAWRAREFMFRRFMETFNPQEDWKVLDVGVTPDTTLIESNHFEQRYPWPRQLTATSIEDVSVLKVKFPEIKFQQISPGPLPYKDGEFDALFCSAVIEHVGSRENQAEFVREISRVSRRFMLTTPNRWFPVDFHTILPLVHWLPQSQHQSILKMLRKDFWAQTENLNLIGAKDIKQMMPQAAQCSVETVKLFGWPSNLIAWGRW